MKAFVNMKNFLPLVMLLFIFSGCEEKSKTGENPAPPAENVIARLSVLYDGMGFHADSVITNNMGQEFFIDNVRMVMSNFFFKDGKDTIIFSSEPFLLTLGMPDQGVLVMPPGGYTAIYGVRFGLDSAGTADIVVNGISQDSDLYQSGVKRDDGMGIDHIIVTGRLIDPSNPLDTTGTIPLSYRIGLTDLSKEYSSLQKNFSVQGDGKISLVIRVDIGPALKDLNMIGRPVITTDPQNLVDYNAAIKFANDLKVELF